MVRPNHREREPDVTEAEKIKTLEAEIRLLREQRARAREVGYAAGRRDAARSTPTSTGETMG